MSKLISKKQKAKLLADTRLGIIYSFGSLLSLKSETMDANVTITTLVKLLEQEIKKSNSICKRMLSSIQSKGTYD